MRGVGEIGRPAVAALAVASLTVRSRRPTCRRIPIGAGPRLTGCRAKQYAPGYEENQARLAQASDTGRVLADDHRDLLILGPIVPSLDDPNSTLNTLRPSAQGSLQHWSRCSADMAVCRNDMPADAAVPGSHSVPATNQTPTHPEDAPGLASPTSDFELRRRCARFVRYWQMPLMQL